MQPIPNHQFTIRQHGIAIQVIKAVISFIFTTRLALHIVLMSSVQNLIEVV
jgi:hypothetical protein